MRVDADENICLVFCEVFLEILAQQCFLKKIRIEIKLFFIVIKQYNTYYTYNVTT